MIVNSRARSNRLARLSALLVALLIGTGMSDAEAATKVKMLMPTRLISEAFAPFTVAKYLGYYQAEGLDVDLVPVGGSNEAAIAVAGGAGDIGAASPGQAIIGMQPPSNLDVKYFYEVNYRSIWTVTVPPDSPIKSFADFKGKRIGVAALGSAGITFGKALATEAGLNPSSDIAYVSVGSGAQAVTSLSQKLVDGLIFSSEAAAKFEANGVKLRYIPLSEGFASLPDVGLLTRQETLASRPDMLIGFARAVAKAYIFTMANPAAAVKISWKMYPEAEPKNMPADEALKGGILVNQRRMEIWSSPATGGVQGKFIEPEWERLLGYMKKQGLITHDIAMSRVYTNALIGPINDFDVEKIREQAENFDLSSIK